MSEEKEIMNTPEINPADQDGISNDQTEKTDSASTKNEDGKEDQEEEYMDILGNGTLMKKVVEQGSGNNIMMGEKVTIELQRTIPEMEKEFPSEQVTFTLGDCDVEQALDLAVALMKLREKAIIISGYKYMFGEIGLEPDIPPRANFKMDVHVISNHGFPDYNKMDLDERFSEAKKKKERGNFYFRRKEYSQAVFVYSKANKIVDPDEGCVYPEAAPEKLQELLEFRGVTLANTSVAQLKVGAADAAIKSASEATKLCPAYSKAYFRLGQAYEGKGNIDEAIKAHKLALKNDPENSKEIEYNQIIHNELSRLTKLNKAAKQSQQEMYSKMFWGAKPPNVSSSQKGKVKDDSSLNAPPPVHQHRPTSPTPSTCPSFDPGFVFNNPMFEAGIEAGKKSLAAGRSLEDTVAMASSFLQKMSSREVSDPEELMRMAGQMAAVIPPEVDAVLRKSFEERMKSLTEEELARAQSEIFKVVPHDLQKLLKREVDGMNDQLVYNTAGAPEKDEGDGLFNQQSNPSAAIQREMAATADVTQEGSVLEGASSALSNCDKETATVTLSDVTQEMSNSTGQASIEDTTISHISTTMCAQDAIFEKESLSFGERASTFEYPTQDIAHVGQERIVQADTSEMNESKAYKEDCQTSHDDSFHVDSLLERDKQVTSVVQQAGLSIPATGDYNLVEERGSDQNRGNAYVEINQVYTKMNYFSWSTDVDTGDTYPEEIMELNVTPPQDIVEVHNEEKKYSWLTNPMLLGTIGVGLAGVGMGLYRYLNSH